VWKWGLVSTASIMGPKSGFCCHGDKISITLKLTDFLHSQFYCVQFRRTCNTVSSVCLSDFCNCSNFSFSYMKGYGCTQTLMCLVIPFFWALTAGAMCQTLSIKCNLQFCAIFWSFHDTSQNISMIYLNIWNSLYFGVSCAPYFIKKNASWYVLVSVSLTFD